MHRHVERQPLIRPIGERRGQYEMRGARHRQELGDALNEREDYDLRPSDRGGLHAKQSTTATAPAHTGKFDV